jgi:hypothetical protein
VLECGKEDDGEVHRDGRGEGYWWGVGGVQRHRCSNAEFGVGSYRA